ncbi:MAG TPA: MBL fold metallo-hydrolase [Clostridiales bacterium]|nr:MBL fold metallo-hydrolase [Clostridiales bacterium]
MSTITTLIENSGSEHHSLETEHGLSFFITTPELPLIFDCGATSRFISNAARLHINLNQADLVICSHSHYDHCGGYSDLIKNFGVKRLITGNSFFEPKFAYNGKKYTYLGAEFGIELLQENNILHETCKDLMQISNDCWIIGNFNRTNAMETIPDRFVRQTSHGYVMDDFSDEVSLAVKSGEGLAVIVGCSHPGILNILETIHERLSKPITSVWGGSHLVEADDNRIAYTISKMKKLGVRRIGFSHCSGTRIAKYCHDDPEVIYAGLSTGDMVEI